MITSDSNILILSPFAVFAGHSSPLQTSKYVESPLRSVWEIPPTTNLLSPSAAVPAGSRTSLGAISPGIFSPGTKLLKKRFGQVCGPGAMGGMSSPDRLMLPGFQQSAIFEAGQPPWKCKNGADKGGMTYQSSKSLWGNEITPQENSYNRNTSRVASDKRKNLHLRGSSSHGRTSSSTSASSSSSSSSQRSRSSYRNVVDGSKDSGSSSSDRNYGSASTLDGPSISPGDQPPSGILDMGDSPVRLFRCNCKKSRCLKLYCECFANLRYCTDCNCVDCHNTKDYELVRKEAIKTTKERNSAAFTNKVTNGKAHSTGCHCKNSLCLKKYCECFQASAYCGVNCKCLSCQNFEGSIALNRVKNAGKEGERKRKGSPGTLAAFSSVTPDNQDQGVKVAKADAASASDDLQPNDTAIRGATPTSALPVRRSSRPTANKSKKLEEEQYEHSLIEASKPARRATRSQMSREQKPTYLEPYGTIEEESPLDLVYPFFGESLPPCSKLVALTVLDHLGNQDIYSMSTVSSYWARASMDDALWTA